MNTRYFSCECQSFEHDLRFCYEDDHDEHWDTVYIDVHLNDRENFFKRLWIGLRYILGIKLGHWEYSEVAFLERTRIPELIKFLEEIRDHK